MAAQDNKNYGAYRVFNALNPKKKPVALPLLMDFSVSNPLLVDLMLAVDSSKIDSAQSLYVDNSGNPNPLTIICAVSNQKIIIAAGLQAYVPVLSPAWHKFLASTVGTLIIPMQVMNFPINACFFEKPTGSTGQDFSANKPAFFTTLLGTLPVNASRALGECQNQSANTLQVVLDDGLGNNISIGLLAPGGAGKQGGSWWSNTFKGRVRVFSNSGTDQFYLHQD